MRDMRPGSILQKTIFSVYMIDFILALQYFCLYEFPL